MINKIKKILNIKNNDTGFVILFAVTLSALLLSIALGVSNIAYKELKFSANARDANEAFLAANTGAECALFYETSTNQAFDDTPPPTINCGDEDSALVPLGSPIDTWEFTILGLGSTESGSTGKGCAKVRVFKTEQKTTIISKGYNFGGGEDDCDFNLNTGEVERQVEVNYAS